MAWVFFAGAVLFICIAHFVRILRWELFIDIYEKPGRKRLIRGLSLGYLLNYFVPFKLGDLLRAWYSGRRMKNGVPLGLSTVIVDRYLDVICVGFIFVVLSLTGKDGNLTDETVLFYLLMTVSVLILFAAIFIFRSFVKKIIRAVAGIFNEKLEASLLQSAWALIWNFKDIFQKISKLKLIGTTVGMWGCYLVSYFLFAEFLSGEGLATTWVDVFVLLFAENGVKDSTGVATLFVNNVIASHPVFMVCYIIAPLIIMLIISYMIADDGGANAHKDNYLNLLPHMDPKERLYFLEGYFEDSNREYVSNYLKINQNISIIRDYSAGSNATTMLCMDGNSTFFRKYAFGPDGEKLYQQILWLLENKDRIALPEILRYEKTEMYCYYDMPYESGAVGLFEYAHSMPTKQVWAMIQNVLEHLEQSVYTVNMHKADIESVDKYIDVKVMGNLEKIRNSKRLRKLLTYDTLLINGVEYNNLGFYGKYLDSEYLKDIFKDDSYSVIHGDLTIENIICQRGSDGCDDFYLIDPNTGNYHDSSNLDYGKLLQSIHGGYEFLMSTKDVRVDDNKIDFVFTRSSTYMELHKRLREYMIANLGPKRTKSIYFHEIIHWLRLIPYKLEKEGKRAVLFYAGLLMIMKDIIEIYGEDPA